MKTPTEAKKNVKEKEGQFAKEQKMSNCCGPTCCGGSSDKTTIKRKEK